MEIYFLFQEQTTFFSLHDSFPVKTFMVPGNLTLKYSDVSSITLAVQEIRSL